MKVYLVRHGETEYNVKELYMTPDVPLSEVGKKQSETLANRFKHLTVDLILSSPYERTKQTAEMVKSVVKKQIEFDDDLKEIVRPSEFKHKPFSDPEIERVKELLDEHKEDPKYHYSDEENFFDLVKRARRLIKKIEQLNKKHLLVITHEGFMKVLVFVMMFGERANPKLFENLYYFFKVKNTGITVVQKEGDSWKLVTWNDHAHLGE